MLQRQYNVNKTLDLILETKVSCLNSTVVSVVNFRWSINTKMFY